MNREIKFRAWNSSYDKMIYPTDKGWFEDLYTNEEGFVQINDIRHLLYEGNKDLVAMQYTGLKDKNGVDIYEGDILRVVSGDEVCVAIVKWDNDGARFTDERDFDGDSFTNYDSFDWVCDTQVIGNIHENPELC